MNDNKDTHRYDDIIDLPHPVSAAHPQMVMIDRTAQISPFAALTGYNVAIQETARLTSEKLYPHLLETDEASFFYLLTF